jgi:hypothetical protein
VWHSLLLQISLLILFRNVSFLSQNKLAEAVNVLRLHSGRAACLPYFTTWHPRRPIFVHTRFCSLKWLRCKAFYLVKLMRGHISILIALVVLRNVLFILMQPAPWPHGAPSVRFFKKLFTCSCSLRSNVDPFSVKCSHFMQMRRIQQPFAGHLLLILKIIGSNYGLPRDQLPCFVSYSGDCGFELRTAQRSAA